MVGEVSFAIGPEKKSLTVQSHHHVSVTTWKEKSDAVTTVTNSSITLFIYMNVWMN